MSTGSILNGDCLAILPTLDRERFTACVTDPPYGLSFMGKAWDHAVPSSEVWREVWRVLKPGGWLLAFFGTRTYHRGVVAIEDAGFEIRDMVAWVHGQGFPKSLDVAKAIDKREGIWRGRCGQVTVESQPSKGTEYERTPKGEPISAYAIQWHGWGTALKPALEPIVVARKPIIGTVAENVLAHGTGAINVDGCRVPTTDSYYYPNGPGGNVNPTSLGRCKDGTSSLRRVEAVESNPLGRWPANLIHDGSDDAVAGFPDCEGMPVSTLNRSGLGFSGSSKGTSGVVGFGDSGSAARFFYCAKPDASERGEFNNHPTVKPVNLMRYLIRMVTPPGGEILDPFLGSGTTGVAADEENVRWVGIERDEASVEIARRRTAEKHGSLFG